MPYCLVILSREAMPQAFTFCAFPWWGTSTAARIVWLFPSWLGAGTCSPSGWMWAWSVTPGNSATHLWHWHHLILLFVPRLTKHKCFPATGISGLGHLRRGTDSYI